MYDEVLRFPVIPNIVVILRLLFVNGQRMQSYDLAHDQENDAGNDPSEEENDLNEKPGSHVIHFEVP